MGSRQAGIQLLARQVGVFKVAVAIAKARAAAVKGALEQKGNIGGWCAVGIIVASQARRIAIILVVHVQNGLGVVGEELAVFPIAADAFHLLDALVDDGFRLPGRVVAAVGHDRWEIEVDVVGSRITRCP